MTLDQILAILTGRKVYNESTNTWHVYDDNGNEIVNASGVLLQGLHGFLLRQYSEVETDFFGGGPINWEIKRKKKDEEEIAEIVEKEIESIIEEKVKVISRKQNAKPESEDYWSLHLYENLLNQRIAEITTQILLQKIRDNAINALRQKAIEEALFKRQLEIEKALFIEYQRIIEEDMIFVFSMLAEM